jgi:hypothetical protein
MFIFVIGCRLPKLVYLKSFESIVEYALSQKRVEKKLLSDNWNKKGLRSRYFLKALIGKEKWEEDEVKTCNFVYTINESKERAIFLSAENLKYENLACGKVNLIST